MEDAFCLINQKYEILHNRLSLERQDEKLLKKIKKIVKESIDDIGDVVDIVFRPFGETTKWIIDTFCIDKGNVYISDNSTTDKLYRDKRIIKPFQVDYSKSVIINTSFNWRQDICLELKQKEANYIDIYERLEKEGINLNTNIEEYRITTHTIPNYFWLKWNNNKNENTFKDMIIALIESYDFDTLEKISGEYRHEYKFLNQTLDDYYNLKMTIKNELKKRNNKQDIIIYWIDAVPYKWRKYLSSIDNMANNAIDIVNTYACTPYTHQVFRSMFAGLLPLDNIEESQKLMDNHSLGINYLESKGYYFKHIGHDGCEVQSCSSKYSYNEDRNVSCNFVYWLGIQELFKSEKPVCLILHTVIETHPPMLSMPLEKPIYNLNSKNFFEQLKISYAYIDKKTSYYVNLFNSMTQIVLSDHGEHTSKYPDRFWSQDKLHTWCMILNGKNRVNKKETRLFSYLNFIYLLKYIVTNDNIFYEKMFSEYCRFQDTDFYNRDAIKAYINKGLADYVVAYRGALNEKYKYSINGKGDEFFYKIEKDEDVEVNPDDYREEFEMLKKVAGDYFPDVRRFERYKYCHLLYEA